MKWENKFTDVLHIKYPIVQAPMLGITTPEMVAAIANEGGLGSLPVGGLSPEKTLFLIHRTKQLTTQPFAVNLFANEVPEYNVTEARKMQDFLERLCMEHHITYEHTALEDLRFYNYREQIDILINEQIPVVSFTFGIIDDNSIQKLRAADTILIGTATSTQESVLLEDNDVDMICAQGIEAGGHRGSFIDDAPLPMIGTLSLVSNIIDKVSRPVIAAGGIHDGKTIKAVFALGAVAAQIGSAFLATEESLAIESYKETLRHSTDTDTQLTRAFSGRWARGIRNKMMMEVENSGVNIPPYPIQNSITTLLRAAAQKQNNKDFTNLWAGQSAYKAEQGASAEIFKKLIEETEILS